MGKLKLSQEVVNEEVSTNDELILPRGFVNWFSLYKHLSLMHSIMPFEQIKVIVREKSIDSDKVVELCNYTGLEVMKKALEEISSLSLSKYTVETLRRAIFIHCSDAIIGEYKTVDKLLKILSDET